MAKVTSFPRIAGLALINSARLEPCSLTDQLDGAE
jgi:hypothetical protein